MAAIARFTVAGPRGGDFWQHAAAVRELATHPLHPIHPQLTLDAPSPFLTPYTQMVAGLARGAGLDAVTALLVMGFINMAAWLLGLWLFARRLDPVRAAAIASLALMLTLFAWGTDPWLYSGFFHLDALRYTAPYPSTFAVGLTLIALGLGPAGGRTLPAHTLRGLASILGMLAVATVVLLAHPLTFPLLAVGLVADALTSGREIVRRVATTAGLLAGAAVLAAAWPHFSLLDLLFSESRVFDSGNEEMYEALVCRTWPTLVLLPVLLVRAPSDRQRTLWLTAIGLIALYAAGAVVGRPSFGRLIAPAMLVAHVAIAGAMVDLASRARPWARARRLAITMAVAIALTWLAWAPLTRLVAPPRDVDPPYAFLGTVTGQYDVVLSDPQTSRVVPTFGGKVVASGDTFAFVPDLAARLGDLTRFFDEGTTAADRLDILRRRDVDHVLLWKTADLPWPDIARQLADWGRVTHDDGTFLLVSRGR